MHFKRKSILILCTTRSKQSVWLWKKANRLDPAKKSDTVKFFVQNQLGVIIAIIAFVPLIILIFLNKDMDKGQKTTAGIIGIALAALAVVFGIDFDPPSVEQYTAASSSLLPCTCAMHRRTSSSTLAYIRAVRSLCSAWMRA